ncbi:MAG: hypothetical protein CW341_11135 [Bacteroidetes bacterium]|nr:hypothetical protein [Bacteroidota bacterium]
MKYLELFFEVLKSSLTLTCLVMIMMLLIEFINVGSAGKWMAKLQHRPFAQILMAILLGLIPGCIGGFAIVSLFTHNLLCFGALVAGMIATFGDEAFVLMAYSPKWTLILSGVLLVIALVAGCLTHLVFRKRKFVLESHGFEVHKEHEGEHHHEHAKANLSFRNLKSMSFPRALLVFGLILYIVAILTGSLAHQHGFLPEPGHHTEGIEMSHHSPTHEHHGVNDGHADFCHHEHDADQEALETSECMEHACLHEQDGHHHGHHNDPDAWENIFFLVLACITLVVVALSSEHFLQSHLWEHVIKHHFLSVFLWTFGVLLCLKVLYLFVDVDTLIGQSHWALWGLMLLAVLIGFIPESGPHLIFVVMFMNGTIPFSILLVSSIVQDGHGALPLLAQSRKNFLLMKALNMLVGLIVGVICLLF